MRRFQVTVTTLLCILTLGVTGCASDPSRSSSSIPSLFGPAKPVIPVNILSPEQARDLGYSFLWVQNLAIPGHDTVAHALTIGDHLYTVEADDHIVSAVTLDNGAVAWRQVVGAGRPTIYSVFQYTIHGDSPKDFRLAVSTADSLYTLDPRTGRTIRRLNLPIAVSSAPAVVDGIPIFGSVTGVVYAFDISQAFDTWRYQVPGDVALSPIDFSGNVLVVDGSCVTTMLNGINGEFVWQRRPAEAPAGQPVIGPLGAYLPTAENKMHALNRVGGQDIWIFRDERPLTGKPILLPKIILQGVGDQAIVAINLIEGTPIWSVPGKFNGAVQTRKGVLLASDNGLTLVDAQSGKTITAVQTKPIRKIIAGPGDSLILVSPSGTIVRLEPLP